MTILNALPVKKKMKKAFSENHIFTRFNLSISTALTVGDGSTFTAEADQI